MWWLRRAGSLGGKALAVGVALWFKHGCTGGGEIAVSGALLKGMGVSRWACSRALRALEQDNLVWVRRSPGQCARVEIILDKAQG